MIQAQIEAGELSEDWTEGVEHELRFQGRLIVPPSLREDVMREFHHSCLAVHPGGTKIYHAVRAQFWWLGLKRSIVEFISRCLTCQQIKAEHERFAGQL